VAYGPLSQSNIYMFDKREQALAVQTPLKAVVEM